MLPGFDDVPGKASEAVIVMCENRSYIAKS